MCSYPPLCHPVSHEWRQIVSKKLPAKIYHIFVCLLIDINIITSGEADVFVKGAGALEAGLPEFDPELLICSLDINHNTCSL